MICIPPARLVHLVGLEPAAWALGITVEVLEAKLDLAERRRRDVPAPAGKTLMTPLLSRPEMDRWETRRAERL